MGKMSFVMYDSWAPMVMMLPDDLAGRLIKAVFSYRESGTLAVEDPALKAILAMIVEKMQTDEVAYSETCERNREAVKTRWARRKELNTDESKCIRDDTNVYERIQVNTEQYEPIRTDTKHTDKDKDIDIYKKEKKESKKKEKQKAFIPPTLEEVKAYVKEKGYTFSPDAFIGYYGSNGWMVGRTKMKDWKSACVTWQSKETKKPVAKKPNWNIESRDYDFDDLERRLMG